MDKNPLLKLKLKDYWDFPQNFLPKEQSGIFAGREHEKEKLLDIITRKKSGSILICGPRGVGKTTLIYKVLQEAQNKQKDIIPVLLSASQIETNEEEESCEAGKLKKREVLINLISRLYITLKDGSHNSGLLTNSIKELYFKSVAKDWKFKKEIAEENKQTDSTKNEEIYSFKIDLDVTSLLTKVFGTLFLFTAVVLQYFPNSKILSVISGIISFALFLSKDIYIWAKRGKIKTILNWVTNNQTDLAKETYLFDASIGNLESDLNEALRQISEKGKKIIFVVDELDKFTSPRQILDLIKTYKNLFSLSPAIFIFITGTEVYETLFDLPQHSDSLLNQLERGNIKTELYRTAFSEIFYLSRPNFIDISRFLDEILENSQLDNLNAEEKKKGLWKKFKHYLSYESRDDFFKLIRIIRDFIKIDRDGIFLEVAESEFLERSQARASFHKALTLIYEKSSSLKPTRWANNERLYAGLFEITKVLENINLQHTFNFSEDTNIKEAQDKFIEVLEKHGHEKTPAIKVSNRDDKSITYTWTNVIPNIGESLDIPYPHEKRFLEIFKKLIDISKDLANALNKNFSDDSELIKWIQEISGIAVSNNFPTFSDIKTKIDGNTTHYNVEETTKYEEELRGEKEGILKNILSIYSNGLVALITNVFQSKLDNKNLFNQIKEETRNKMEPKINSVIHNSTFTKQLLIIENCTDDEISEIEKEVVPFKQNYKVINIKNDLKDSGIDSIAKISSNEIKEWFMDDKIVVGKNNSMQAKFLTGIPTIEKNKKKLKIKLNKIEGISIDAKSTQTFIVMDGNYSQFEAKMNVLLAEKSIFNFIFGFNENENKQVSFFMARLDARNGFANSLLQANFGTPWDYVIKAEGNTAVKDNHNFEIKLVNKNLQVLLNGTPIISHTFSSDIKGKIGLMNELNEVIVENFEIKEIENTEEKNVA